MSVELPKPVAVYFHADADKADRTAVVRCFTDTAVVKDEGNVYTGRAEIARWKTESAAKYSYTSKPIKSERLDGKTIVTSHLTGDFPGSPVDLRYIFGLDGDRIASLEIIP
jgi:hypothetical protein